MSSSIEASIVAHLADKDWFHSVGQDQNGRVIVYANYLNQDVMSAIPETLAGKQVLVHFTSHLKAKVEDFVNQPPLPSLVEEMDRFFPEPEVKLEELLSEIDRLLLKCSFQNLQSVFFEIHDGKNAVSDVSAEYPEVRQAMERLYDQFGFDIINEEIG
jgi:hypothetical protein